MYIHERNNWTDFQWDNTKISLLIEEASRKQGLLFGRLSGLGFDSKLKAMAENMTKDVVFSSEIEGIKLNADEVRSSIARKLGIDNVKYTAPSHYIDSVVAVMLDAVEHYDQPLTKEKLCGWQSAFFPSGYSEGSQIEVGQYRTHEEHIVSGMFGREKVHYIAPSPSRIEDEMDGFLAWFNQEHTTSSIIASAIAHFWFVSIHPFEDGNGRLARILSDMLLARGDKSELRFYNISSEINKDKKHYYEMLERAQKGDSDLTEWITWYAKTLIEALNEANNLVSTTLNKSFFWQNILREDVPGAKRPSYSIIYDSEQISGYFSNVRITEEAGRYHLKATFKERQNVEELILPLDAERYNLGELTLENLLNKYCSYLV